MFKYLIMKNFNKKNIKKSRNQKMIKSKHKITNAVKDLMAAKNQIFK